MRDFESFSAAATGCQPYGYQARIARDGLPDTVTTPTGTGKSGLLLAWLWRLYYDPGPAATPRRLVYALPPGSLADPVAALVRGWLARLGRAEDVSLHVVLGPWGDDLGDWRQNMHRPAIVIGNTDVLVSKALNRGFGIGRALSPVDFCLVTNGAQWIVDEAALCPQATATLRRLAGWARTDGTAEPFGMTVFSSLPLTSAGGSRPAGDHQPIAPAERAGELAVRLGARRTIRRAPVAPGDYQALARLAAERHRPGTLTLVALNTVAAARQVHRRLGDAGVQCTLLHSRLRGVERAARLAGLTTAAAGGIVVTAEVAEGLDLSAAVLLTEAAPLPALVRRAGRCNRDGSVADAELWWLPPASGDQGSDTSGHGLDSLEGTSITTEELAARAVPSAPRHVAVIGRDAFAELFDTMSAVDAVPYLLDGDDADVELAWATWTPGPDGAPDPEVRYPPAEYRCRVPAGEAVLLAARHPVWRFDRSAGQWTRLGDGKDTPPRPLELLLVNATAGGYDLAAGFDPAAPVAASGLPSGLTAGAAAGRMFGLAHGARTPIPAIFGQPPVSLLTDLAQFRSGGAGTWQQHVRDLLARYGPFTLAYLETIVRVADWRASAGQDLPTAPAGGQG